LLLARREPGGFGAAAARRASLPTATETLLTAAARARGEDLLKIGERSARILYWPDLVGDRPPGSVERHDRAFVAEPSAPSPRTRLLRKPRLSARGNIAP